MWLKELNFLSVTQRIEPFEIMTHRTELFFRGSKNWTSFFLSEYDSKNWTCFWMTQRIELVFLNMIQRIEHFFDLTQRIEPFYFNKIQLRELNLFLHDSKNWFFPVWLTELNFFFFESDSQNWTFFFFWIRRTLFLWIWPKNWTLISWIWRKELNRLIFECDAKNWTV